MRAKQVPFHDLGGIGIFNVMARALALLPQEQDRFERLDSAAPEARALRRGLLDRLNNWYWKSEQRAIEAYLAKSQDIYDLEARIRHLERRDPHPYF